MRPGILKADVGGTRTMWVAGNVCTDEKRTAIGNCAYDAPVSILRYPHKDIAAVGDPRQSLRGLALRLSLSDGEIANAVFFFACSICVAPYNATSNGRTCADPRL